MAHSGQVLEGADGYRLRLISISDDLLEMEAAYAEAGQLPPEHLHPVQTERFEVLEGSLRAVIAGEERRYEEGESFVIATGTPHTMTADGPALMRWEVRPALRTAEFFEALYTGAAATDPAAFLAEFAAEFRLSP